MYLRAYCQKDGCKLYNLYWPLKCYIDTKYIIFSRFWDTNVQVAPDKGLNKDKSSKSELSITLHETPKVKLETAVVEPETVMEKMSSQEAQRPPPAADYVEKLKDSPIGQIVSKTTLFGEKINWKKYHCQTPAELKFKALFLTLIY